MSKSNGSPKRSGSAQTRQMAQLATIWNAMSGTDKSSWANLAGQLNKTNTNNAPGKYRAHTLFIQQNFTFLNAGGPAQTTAPLSPAPPTPLENLTLTATLGPGGVSITLHSPNAYPDIVLVYAARPLLAGVNSYKKSSFHLVGKSGGLAQGTTPLTALYTAKYRVPSAGYEIALELVGINSQGFRTDRTLVTAIALAQSDAADTQMLKAA